MTTINGPVIEAGESLSDAIDCSSGVIVRLTMPTDWTPANLTFQVSPDGVDYNDLYNTKGEEITLRNIVPGSSVVLLEPLTHSFGFLKIRSGTRDYPVAQDARREFAVTVEKQ